MLGRDVDWYHFRPLRSTLTPQIGGRFGGSKLTIGIAAKRKQIEHNFVLRDIGKSWVGFQLAQLPTP